MRLKAVLLLCALCALTAKLVTSLQGKPSTFRTSFLGSASPKVTSINPRDVQTINCKGSALCHMLRPSRPLSKLVSALQDLPDNVYYTRGGQHIACFDHLCAFLEYSDAYASKSFAKLRLPDGRPIPAAASDQIKQLAARLEAYGCQACGSVPVGYPEKAEGDVVLRFDYVSWPCVGQKEGLCPFGLQGDGRLDGRGEDPFTVIGRLFDGLGMLADGQGWD
ncbi:hypothetical protein H2201_005063 [Coniosporium apollinis]|uniref:Killer toxin Kp4 domain-containing protein n=2 Tax=Coniosporium TaxID=2810619 RepID=A0ABQ9NRR1_9PEZI|nr:hypothetical protein H2199_000714 [Cladosporium sp. JES 115]KAJ9664842.1 hypothetical protein H2201_005063 [Coniosporium apollinis]